MSRPPEFSAVLDRRDDVLHLVLTGELDLATMVELEAALPSPAPGELLVLDLRELDFIDSSGLHVFMRLDVASRAEGWSLAIVRGGPDVQRVLDLIRLGDRIRTVDAPAEASPALR